MKLYLYPSKSQNEFLELNKEALRQLNFTVEKIDPSFIRDLLRMKKDSIVVLNWVEDRVYGRGYRTVFQSFFKMTALIIFAKLLAKDVIWVRHNFQPHNGTKTNYRYRFLCGLYKLMKIKPTSLERYYATPSLVHPLYKKDAALIDEVSKPEPLDAHKSNLVVFFGAVKRYKNLHDVLDTWPKDIPLKIAGRCSDKYYQTFLEQKIAQQDLQVQWDNKFLDDEELNDLLKNSKFVLLPHADSTMISSGSFYHAIGEGCNVITNSSRFGQSKADQHKFVTIYDPSIISLEYLTNIYQDRVHVMGEALSCYGEKRVIAAWHDVLMVNNN